MQEIPTVEQPTPAPQPPIYPPHPYQEYAAQQQPYYGQPYYGPPVLPPKKRWTGKRILLWIVVIFAILFVGSAAFAGIMAGIRGGTSSTPTPVTTTAPAPVQPTTPTQPTQPAKPVVVPPRILGSIADFDTAYGKPLMIFTDQQMHDSSIDKYADRIASYKVGSDQILVASAGGTVIAIAGPKSIDYHQYFPEGVKGGPDATTDTMDIYDVNPSGTSVIGKIAVDDNTELWVVIYTPTVTYPPQ
jgi:hypothetical protein